MTTAKQTGIYTAGHIPFQVGLEGVLSEGMDVIARIEELSFELVDCHCGLVRRIHNSSKNFIQLFVKALDKCTLKKISVVKRLRMRLTN